VLNLSNRVNILEQNASDCQFEIVDVTECKDKICVNTVKKIMTKLSINAILNYVFWMSSKVLNKPKKMSVCCNSVADKQ